jgi:hypothetical protein
VAEWGAEDRSGDSAELAGQGAPIAPDFEQRQFRFLGFDGPAWIQLMGGLVIGLIALYSSYDHINVPHRRINLPQQWGVWLIALSLPLVLVDAQLASRSRRRDEDRSIAEARETARERDRAAEERQRNSRLDRIRARLDRGRLAFELDPSPNNRRKLQRLLNLLNSPELADLYRQPGL